MHRKLLVSSSQVAITINQSAFSKRHHSCREWTTPYQLYMVPLMIFSNLACCLLCWTWIPPARCLDWWQGKSWPSQRELDSRNIFLARTPVRSDFHPHHTISNDWLHWWKVQQWFAHFQLKMPMQCPTTYAALEQAIINTQPHIVLDNRHFRTVIAISCTQFHFPSSKLELNCNLLDTRLCL